MSEWRSMADAPMGRPVRLWASLDPGDRLMSWRTFLGIQKYRGHWHTYGKRALRLFPSHWTEPGAPPTPDAILPPPA